MNEVLSKENKIENMIYEIRGVQVMLDSDLAKLYECTNGTKDINKAVKRNINRFPNDFYFQLSEKEYNDLRFQNGTLEKNGQGQFSKYLPHAFTEQGVAMLSSVLKTNIAAEMSIKIIRAFVYMRKYISENNKSNILVNHEERILKLEQSFDKFKSKEKTIIYEGKIYDVFSVLMDIFNEAKNEIIIIDNYSNKDILDMLRSINKRIIIISKNIDDLLIKKYKSQYQHVEFINTNPFHDRYIVLDRSIVYSSGMSLKDVGKSFSYINREQEEIFVQELLKRLNDML